MDLFAYGFMQRALIAAALTGLVAPAVGTYLVQRRLALMGDGLGHVAVTGIALGLLTNSSPLWTAMLVTVTGAVLIELIRERGSVNGDVALALLFYGGLAGGVLLTGIGGQSASTLQEYLFGSILTITIADIWAVMGLTAVVLAIALGLAPQLFAVSQDVEFARVAGLRVRAYNLLIAVLAAASVTVAMRTVGLLLVSALMVVPVATAQQLTRSFRATLLGAMVLGVAASVGGLVASAVASSRAQVAPGSTIVIVALLGFAVTWPIGSWLRHRRRLTSPFDDEPLDGLGGPDGPLDAAHRTVTEPHVHRHGADCGHVAVPHGDHVDYLHDGHRHAPHEAHYDEH
ncbi:metal ABC transporter permease [Nocardioides sp. TRM66260-LWL]|uniref:metal ABC transporter permease n=1 Tax=Nocardioides sp. TRM66260-LWL TaxID=2874478 RepID=UPI001CC500AB|nr:metal ABC transporter permease [Nocardioides sp. TRM66260-LWL]MBZ5735852.1 metal ABC transporter permease [Nocardioides sp. TRM66260-LWL]